jgi:hypothetical protein
MTMKTKKSYREKWLMRTNSDGSQKGQLYFRSYRGRVFYGTKTDPEVKGTHEFLLELNDYGEMNFKQPTHERLQRSVLHKCKKIFEAGIEEIEQLEKIPFGENQEDVSDAPDGIELNLKFTESQLEAMKKILHRMINDHSRSGFEEWDEGLFRDVVGCLIAFSNARQKLLKGEKAFVPWYHYRID